jgi:hypothetical protein
MPMFMAFGALERMAYLGLPRSLESMGHVADGKPERDPYLVGPLAHQMAPEHRENSTSSGR